MAYDPNNHHRRSIRLRGYDYTQPGAYFITICAHNRECLFGDVVNGTMRLNDLGKMVADCWNETPALRPNIKIDEWVVMPNHFHGIVVIDGPGRGTARRAPTPHPSMTPERFGKPIANSIPTIVRGFKSAATKRANEYRKTPGMKLWQRNYWEHIVRDDAELGRIRAYIRNNPTKWEMDRLYKSGRYGHGVPCPMPCPNESRESNLPYGGESWMI